MKILSKINGKLSDITGVPIKTAVIFHCWGRWQLPQQYEYVSWRTRNKIVATIRQLRKKTSQPVILFVPSQTWFSSGFQRPHQMARAFADLGAPVIFCEPWHCNPAWLTEETLKGRRFRGVKKLHENLYLLRYPDADLADLIADINPEGIIMFWPHHARYISAANKSCIIYEMIDDHSLVADSQTTRWQNWHAKWLKEADIMVASADDLMQQLLPERPDTLLLPNGVRLEDWTSTQTAGIPEDMREAVKAPVVVGYYGALAEWFDWDIWIGMALKKPEWSFVLIGYPYDGNIKAAQERLAQYPNIYYLGPKPYLQLTEYLAAFDVATIPFVINAITHGCSPVKLFEYMAGGKPIVCTPMRETLKYQSILFATNDDEFISKIEEALVLCKTADYQGLLLKESTENTWKARAQLLIDRVKSIKREKYAKNE